MWKKKSFFSFSGVIHDNLLYFTFVENDNCFALTCSIISDVYFEVWKSINLMLNIIISLVYFLYSKPGHFNWINGVFELKLPGLRQQVVAISSIHTKVTSACSKHA